MNFVKDYGTGNLIPEPRTFVPFNGKDIPSAASTVPARPAAFTRVSKRTAAVYPLSQPLQTQQSQQAEQSSSSDPATRSPEINGKTNKRSTTRQGSSQHSRSRGNSTATNKSYPRPSDDTVPSPEPTPDISRTGLRRSLRHSTPLPIPGIHQSGDQETRPAMPPLPPPDQDTGERILFYGACFFLVRVAPVTEWLFCFLLDSGSII